MRAPGRRRSLMILDSSERIREYVARCWGGPATVPDRSAPGAASVVIADGDEVPTGVLSLRRIRAERVGEGVVDELVAAVPPGADDVLTVCWTSGTETEPKGVPRSHNHWIAISGV